MHLVPKRVRENRRTSLWKTWSADLAWQMEFGYFVLKDLHSGNRPAICR